MKLCLPERQKLVLIRTAYSTTICRCLLQLDLIRQYTLKHVRDRYLEGMTKDVSACLYGEFRQPNRNMYTVILHGDYRGQYTNE